MKNDQLLLPGRQCFLATLPIACFRTSDRFRFHVLFCGLLASLMINAQSLPIIIDSQFDDWTSAATAWADPANDGDDIELLRMVVANDEEHLFIQLETSDEINLIDDHKLTLYIDADLNPGTGTYINGLGADLEIRLGERDVFYELPSGQGFMSLNDIRFRHQPSVTSTVFEMAFDLQAVSNAGYNLFTANGVRLLWKDETGPFGDAMPDNGNLFTYLFDDSPTPAFVPTTLEKETASAIRLLTWNTLNNGLDDIDREVYFSKVLSVLQPDIITFNECWDLNNFQAASFMNAAIPLEGIQNWQTVKQDNGNITASRYPILQNWLILPGQRLTASLIDIPDHQSEKDLLIINAHFRCCENNFDRQREADAFVQFIQDAKTPGGVIDLPAGTPFVLSGDLNLVGNRQQLTTLLAGETVNTGQFGPGGPMDWDNTDLVDVISLHTDQRFSYTWKNDFSSFPPSRIDYHIISDAVLDIEKSYTLQTGAMSPERLVEYGLSANDTRFASDHAPKITDFLLPAPVAVRDVPEFTRFSAFPNPVKNTCQLEFSVENRQEIDFIIQNDNGKNVRSWRKEFPSGPNVFTIDLTTLPNGVYLLKLKTAGWMHTVKLIKA